jgi:hypothetical protein
MGGGSAIDEDFELTYALYGGTGAIDGFLVAINSEIAGVDATDVFNGYRKKLSRII